MFFTHAPRATITNQRAKWLTLAVWFVGALDGSDTSRTQVALDAYVDRGVVTPTKGQDAEFYTRVHEISLDIWVRLKYLAKVVKQSRSRYVRHWQWS